MKGQHQAQVDGAPAANGLLTDLACGLLAVAVLPLAVGWHLTPILGESATVWARRRTLMLRVGLAATLGLALLVMSWGTLLAWGVPWGWGTTAALAVGWLLLSPSALVLALWRMPRLSTRASQNRTAPAVTDRVRQASWQGMILRARRAVQGYGACALAVVVLADTRDRWTRWRDARHARPPESQWVRPTCYSWWLRVLTEPGELVVLPDDPPRVVIIAVSRHGKTSAQRDLVLHGLQRHWRVVVFDLKGDTGDAAAYIEDAAAQGRTALRWSERCPFDPFAGGNEASVEVIAALLPSSGSTDSQQQHWANQSKDLVRAMQTGREGSPKSMSQLRAWLYDPLEHMHPDERSSWRGNRVNQDSLAHAVGDVRRAIEGVRSGWLDGGLHPHGWSWDENPKNPWDLVVVSGSDEATRRGVRAMLADLTHYRVLENGRRRWTNDSDKREGDPAAYDRPMLILLDEAASILDAPGAPAIAVEVEQIRASGIGLGVAAQSYVGLGDQRERLVTSGATLLIGNTPAPEELSQLAGTVRGQEVAHQGDERGLTGGTSAREQHQAALDPDRVRSLPPGVWALLEPGQPVRWICFPHR